MKINLNRRFDKEEIRRQASEWLARVDRGLTATEQDEFSDWMSADYRNGAEYARLRRRWFQLDRLVEWYPEHSAEPNPDLLAPSSPKQVSRIVFSILSLAAVVAVGAGYITLKDRYVPKPEHTEVVLTAPAQSRQTLPDGSIVELNRGAIISVDYSLALRRVRLEKGEAHFTVQKNADRPFVVTAHGIDVRAVGTAFNVRLDSAVVEVLVTEGKVQVDAPPRPEPMLSQKERFRDEPLVPQLVARQRAILSISSVPVPPQIATLTDGEIERVLAWQHRLLEFTATPLAEVVAEFNKRNTIQIVVVDPDLNAEPITALVRSDNVEAILRLMQSGFAGFSVRVERRGDTEIFLHRAR